MSKPKPNVVLSELQTDVVRILWRHGETSVADVARILGEERGLKHTTVATLLARLHKRGVLAQRREGRQLLYLALVSEAQVRRSMVSNLLGNLFGGDSRELVAHLLRESELTAGDLDRLRKRLGTEKSS
ncbi:MAG TPA: BlaI/MecI/CopY family transcriptional regulator [Rudaea sp.]|jgi:BlaI family penicillinase repressor|nr:BlaI/MecI/CopY family transcriptional regulator [Rudaea sp.]